MRITIAQGPFLPVPALMGGAIEKIWYGLGRAFAKAGHQVTYISRHHSELPKSAVVDGVRHVRVKGYDRPLGTARRLWCDLLFSLRALRTLPPADVVITHTFWLPVLLGLGFRSRGAIYVHVARYPKRQIVLYRRAARLQTVSTPVGQAIARADPTAAARVTVIPNPLPDALPILAPGTGADHCRKPWLLYVGRVDAEKGMDLLIDAFGRFAQTAEKSWRLVIVGPWEEKYGGGGERYYKQLRERAKSIDDRIDWVGPEFDEQRLYAYYREASLFVYPSLAERGETFGVAPLEAMASGCPPIVSDLACFKDFVRDEENGFVFDHRAADPVASLADKMRAVVSAPPHRIDEVRDSAVRTGRNYTLERIAAMYLADIAAAVREHSLNKGQ